MRVPAFTYRSPDTGMLCIAAEPTAQTVRRLLDRRATLLTLVSRDGDFVAVTCDPAARPQTDDRTNLVVPIVDQAVTLFIAALDEAVMNGAALEG